MGLLGAGAMGEALARGLLAAGALDSGQHGFKVRPARHFWHHATKSRMLVDTARDGVSQQCASPHETHSGFIA